MMMAVGCRQTWWIVLTGACVPQQIGRLGRLAGEKCQQEACERHKLCSSIGVASSRWSHQHYAATEQETERTPIPMLANVYLIGEMTNICSLGQLKANCT